MTAGMNYRKSDKMNGMRLESSSRKQLRLAEIPHAKTTRVLNSPRGRQSKERCRIQRNLCRFIHEYFIPITHNLS
jgi:hypothetical protein